MENSHFYNQEKQPASNINKSKVIDKDINVLIGICIGMLSDGSFNQQEAEYLRSWLAAKRHLANEWPANVIFNRLEEAMKDGVLDSEEESEILELMVGLVGGKHDEYTGENPTTALPYCDPQPQLNIAGSNIVLTGKFIIASRNKLEDLLQGLGANTGKDVSKKTDYVIVGSVGSRDWQFASFGRKIQKAIELKSSVAPIAIVSEATLADALDKIAVEMGIL